MSSPYPSVPEMLFVCKVISYVSLHWTHKRPMFLLKVTELPNRHRLNFLEVPAWDTTDSFGPHRWQIWGNKEAFGPTFLYRQLWAKSKNMIRYLRMLLLNDTLPNSGPWVEGWSSSDTLSTAVMLHSLGQRRGEGIIKITQHGIFGLTPHISVPILTALPLRGHCCCTDSSPAAAAAPYRC